MKKSLPPSFDISLQHMRHFGVSSVRVLLQLAAWERAGIGDAVDVVEVADSMMVGCAVAGWQIKRKAFLC